MMPEGANNGGLLQVLDQHRVGEELDEWHQQLQDLEDHIRHCQCSCDHMGYGNYWSYNDVNSKVISLHIQYPHCFKEGVIKKKTTIYKASYFLNG